MIHFCSDGVTTCDNGLTAAVASPELIDGVGIGLETDIYAFGIVMWEVFTRREAWHWIKGCGPLKDQAIITQVGVYGRRPKMPGSLSPDCAKYVRKCLHTDPGRRPNAKELSRWINDCREAVGEELKGSGKAVVRKRMSMERNPTPGVQTARYMTVPMTSGRVAVATSAYFKRTSGANPGFSLNVIEVRRISGWKRSGWQGKETETA